MSKKTQKKQYGCSIDRKSSKNEQESQQDCFFNPRELSSMV